MGLRLSCIRRGSIISRQVPQPDSPAPPARVITANGSLKELPAPSPLGVAISDVLSLDAGGDTAAASSFFVCNTDVLYFNEHPPALASGDLLQPGQMYFVLPAELLGRPLSAADMAALAVRASAALASSSGDKPRRRRGGKSKKKAVGRVMPVHEDAEDAVGVDLFNERLNELTLGQDGVVLLSPVKNKSSEEEKLAAADRARLKRALSIIREDAE
ncbi:unnamed protein product [Urochloa decumbens]|uniref:Uncharacterized protein n=1 Tax=Urochloa decumbens TaxID=240449 RepID=A0ABC9A3S5_9POAL